MALTASTTRVTRSKRISNASNVDLEQHLDTPRATTTTKVSPKITIASTKKSMVKTTSNTTKITKMTITTRALTTAGVAIDDEKENIDPLTGLDPLQTAALKSGKSKKVFGAGRNGNVAPAVSASDKVKPAPVTAAAPKASGSRVKKPRAPVGANGEETIAGRLLAMRRNEPHSDRLARDLTVRPLVDLSEAFGIVEKPILVSKEEPTIAAETKEDKAAQQEQEEDEEPSVHALIAAELDAALRVLALTTDEHKRLPTVLQRNRGVKRAIHSPATSGFSQTSTSKENARDLRRLSDPSSTTNMSTTARPMKRMRKSAPGTATPKFLSTPTPVFDDATSVPCAPPNTPVRGPRALPSVSDEVPGSVPIPIASTQQKSDEEEETQESSFDNTQGSSHFSSFLGSSSFLGITSSFNAGDESLEEESGGSWSRWL